MYALVFDKSQQAWEKSKGFQIMEVPEPVIDAQKNPTDTDAVIVKVHYAGVCGSDRGIWYRMAFRNQILNSLKEDPPSPEATARRGRKNYRILGHEVFGEVVQVGSGVTTVRPGDMISCESHVICRQCFQCTHDQENVCVNQKILGISHDGGFAQYIKVPAHIVWKTDISKIRPEIAVLQEPFGNAVHAASKVNLKDKRIAIFGLGPIGQFLILIAKAQGAKHIIGIDPKAQTRTMAKKLGADQVLDVPEVKPQETVSRFNLGVDIAFEMSGSNEALNYAIASVRRGGDVILFGLKNADFILKDYNALVMKGITLHAVAGRQIWKTWETTRNLLENKANGIQEKLWNVILKKGEGTILRFEDYSKEVFEQRMLAHPKILIKF